MGHINGVFASITVVSPEGFTVSNKSNDYCVDNYIILYVCCPLGLQRNSSLIAWKSRNTALMVQRHAYTLRAGAFLYRNRNPLTSHLLLQAHEVEKLLCTDERVFHREKYRTARNHTIYMSSTRLNAKVRFFRKCDPHTHTHTHTNR
jgi:hypothetical protein